MKIRILKGWLDQFKFEAKSLYPKECYAILLGKRKDDRVTVEHVIFPDLDGTHSSSDSVTIQGKWYQHAEKVAALKGLEVVGDIHSHCRESDKHVDEHAPSQVDWEQLGHEGRVLGICAITKLPSGQMRASIEFWHGNPRAEVELVKGSN